MYMYSIKDERTGVFFQPYFMTHDVVAIRMFRGTLKRKDSLLSDFPEDYAIYRIGEWDERTGKVTQEEPVRLGFAYEFLEEEEPG